MDIKEGRGSNAHLGNFMRFLFFFSNCSSRVNGPGAIVDAGDMLALSTVLETYCIEYFQAIMAGWGCWLQVEVGASPVIFFCQGFDLICLSVIVNRLRILEGTCMLIWREDGIRNGLLESCYFDLY